MHFSDRVAQQYQGEKGQNYHATLNFVPEPAYPWVARQRAAKLSAHIRAAHTVLEYGVGTGWNLAEITCKRRIGYDVAEHLAPVLASHKIEYINDIGLLSDESIDVVVCHHVLEHTGNPPDTLQQIRRILRRGGRLLLFVPYEIERRYRRYDPHEPNLHLYAWNVQTLGNLVAGMDFRVRHGTIMRFGYDRFAAVWAHRLRLGEPGYRLIRRLAHLIKPAFEVCLVAEKG